MEKIESGFAEKLLNNLISSTLSRHCNLSSEEYLKEIGFENVDIAEDEAVRIAKYNTLLEITKQLLLIKDKLKELSDIVNICIQQSGKKG